MRERERESMRSERNRIKGRRRECLKARESERREREKGV